MNYMKVIRLSGSYFAREFDKKKKNKEQFREVNQKTVAEQFCKGQATVRIVFEDGEKADIVIDSFSEEETIKKYLGKDFLK